VKKTRILVAIVVVFIVQVSCKVTQRSYPTSISTPIVVNVPELLVRGEKYKFSIETTPGVECHAGIAYYNLSDKWTITDLPTIESDKNGICEWSWEIPEDAKDGLGEFRGNIQVKEESHNTFPATFCIGQCP
jgi:hypothetical protein